MSTFPQSKFMTHSNSSIEPITIKTESFHTILEYLPVTKVYSLKRLSKRFKESLIANYLSHIVNRDVRLMEPIVSDWTFSDKELD